MEPPGHLRGPNEVVGDQLVERHQRVRIGHFGGRQREVELERVAGDGGPLGQTPRQLGERVELADDRGHDRVGHAVAAGSGARDVAIARHAGELEEVEGVATARLIEALAFGGAGHVDQGPRVGGRERGERDPMDELGLGGSSLDGGQQRAIGLSHAKRRRNHHSRARRMPQDV